MTLRGPAILLCAALAATAANAARNTTGYLSQMSFSSSQSSLLGDLAPRDKCPPCFNCLLPKFKCGQYGDCDAYSGQCNCPPGWGGIDCLTPQCDSLADGDERHLREDGKTCECKDGWGGINCNVCQHDAACKGFPLWGLPPNWDDDDTAEQNMTCYTGGETIFSNHQMCDVTNRKILDMLPGRPPQVTFSCNNPAKTCDFQFWVDQVESFYCALDTCTTRVEHTYDANITLYECEHLRCNCVADRFLCGEDGSINLDDFLNEEIKGPATFRCDGKNGCSFEEPAMNDLIDQVFGDSSITLNCHGGECLHYSQVPGYVAPEKPDNTRWVALSIAGAVVFVVLASLFLWYAGRIHRSDGGAIKLPDNEVARLMADHVPASLQFVDVSYQLGGRTILDGITGSVHPGQIMAIMGASGAGKSTFLDILARKNKRGIVTGTTFVNGRVVDDDEFRNVVGFVDQEDTLMSTLTVYETVLYSALLRLPRDMSLEAKKFRTLETMNELGILHIKDSRIGDSGHRSISGGEKRRVSIACELVTSPSILFLDEPTSGLDAYNAFNVVESLVTLARDYKRTVVFTIHQPRSNIVSLFDQLVLLAQGKLIYAGDLDHCQAFFRETGHPCPAGYNVADFLIDLTMQEKEKTTSSSSPTVFQPDDSANLRDEERGLIPPGQAASGTDDTELLERPSSGSFVKRKASQFLEAMSISSRTEEATPTPAHLVELVDAYADSDVAKSIRADIASSQVAQTADVAETTVLRGRKRASWPTQFRILSGRAFKNLYRDPGLLAAQYSSSIALALLCGLFYHDVTDDIGGFQNRLGVFFFTLALFGFACLSSLGLFANERILFMRERANGYYSSFTYFASKVLFDILPLRVVPPILFGGIVYGLVGLVPTVAAFWKFILVLVLFNLTTASVTLLISVACESTSVANLCGTLVILFNLLFTGLLINRSKVAPWLQWLHDISFFHAAFEALAVNELRYLTLREHKYGVDLDVPAATILSTFGLRAQSFWWPNVALLGIFFGGFTILSYVVLHVYVRERR